MSGDDRQDMKGLLSDLLAKAKGGAELDMDRLRGEIRKGIGSGEEIIVKFRGLLESLEEIIPEEKQRYNAAIKALASTTGLSRKSVLESIDGQLGELQVLKKGALSALPGLRDELKVMESRSQEIRGELAKLREKMAQFEKEEQKVLEGIAARKSEMKIVEEAVSRLFADIGAEMAAIRKKIETMTAEKAAPLTVAKPEPAEAHTHEEEPAGAGETFKTEETPGPRETEFLKRCPMCGGQIHLLVTEAMWKCYTCGHEESSKGETDGARAAAAESVPAPGPPPSAMSETLTGLSETQEDKLMPLASAPFAAPPEPSPSGKKAFSKKKDCPVCRRLMDWDERDKSWFCKKCGYRRMVF